MDNPVIFIVLVMVFAASVLAVQGVYFLVRARREGEEEKVRKRLGFETEEEEEIIASLIREQAQDSVMDSLGNLGESMNETIKQSGLDLTVSGLVTQMFVASLASMVAGMLTIGPMAILPALMVAYIPFARVSRAATKRAKDLLAQMPDALELMGRAMQAGTGLSECFRLVQDEMPEPIASEFGRVYDEVRFGKDWRMALQALVERNPTLFDLRLLVSSILLQRETGGNMIETVNRISKLIRQRYVFDAKVRAMTSEARASGFVLAVMPLGVLVLVMFSNASYLTPMVDTGIGQMLIVYAFASYIVGLVAMQVTSQVEV